jgi:hypothetical protein
MTRAALALFATAAAAFALVPATAGALTLAATTESPQDVSSSGATLRGSVTVSVLGGSLAWQYGTTTSYGTTTRSVSTGLLGLAQTLSIAVTGLTPSTTYHVRVVAKSGLTTSYGRDVTFTTSAPPRDDSSGSGSGSGSGSSGSGSSDSASSDSGSGSTGSSDSGSSSPSISGSDGGATDDTSGESTSSGTSGGGAGDSSGASGDGSGATTPPGVATAAVTPVLGKTFAIATVKGTVTATAPSGQAVDLSAAQAVPTGTLIDTRAGTVELTTALDRKGATQTGRFWGGLFEVHQATTARGLTQLVLRGGDFSGCPRRTTAARRAVAHAAKAINSKKKKKKSPPRSLWGSDDHGRFTTRGRGSVATVRGTRWLTEDRCDGTLTSVAAGAVAVRDLRRGRTVVVTKNHHYLARIAP